MMEQKKTPEADLEKDKPTFLLMGLVVVLSILFAVFEWQTDSSPADPDPSLLSNLFVEKELDISTESQHRSESALPEQIVVKEVSPAVISDGFEAVDHPVLTPDSVQTPPSSEVSGSKQVNQTEHHVKSNQDSVTVHYTDTDTLPMFPGGHAALVRYLYESIKYPPVAQKQGIQGQVVCSFIINQDGTVSDAKIEKGVYAFLDDEALRVIRSMPQWKPGMRNGKAVRVKYYMPVVFKL